MSRVIGQVPEIRTRVEGLGVRSVITRNQVALHLEEVFGIAQMRHQVTRNLRSGLKLSGEDLAPSIDHRVVGIPLVQRYRTVVGIYHSLDRVAHVVHAVRQADSVIVRARIRNRGVELDVVGIGIRIRGRVAVNNPHHPFGGLGVVIHIHHRGIHLGIQGEIGRHHGDALYGVAVEQNLRIRVNLLREENLGRLELDGVHQTLPQVSDRGTALSAEGVVHTLVLRSIRGIVEFLGRGTFRPTHNRVLRGILAEIDARLVFTQRPLGRNPLLPEVRRPVGADLGTISRHHAKTVGKDRVLVYPRLL